MSLVSRSIGRLTLSALPMFVLATALLVSGEAGLSLLSSDERHRPPTSRGHALDPLKARLVDLDQPLTSNAPTFPGDPTFQWDVWNCVGPRPDLGPRCDEGSGYLLERITSLGTHTGTHISAPCHFFDELRGRRAPCLEDLDESVFALHPLVVIDVRDRVARSRHGDFLVTTDDLRTWERRHGKVPADAYVVLHTGWSRFFSLGNATRPGRADDYFDAAPGLSLPAAEWLLRSRRVAGLGSDAFGPDASSDADFSVSAEALERGAITIENVGAGLEQMRPNGDYVSLNGPDYAPTPAQRQRRLPGSAALT